MKKNITPELAQVYVNQTQKYFDLELMNQNCDICKFVPSYQKYSCSVDEDEKSCRDCPLGVTDEGPLEFIHCVSHPTFIPEYDRQLRSTPLETFHKRGNYMIAMGEAAGIDMSGVKKYSKR